MVEISLARSLAFLPKDETWCTFEADAGFDRQVQAPPEITEIKPLLRWLKEDVDPMRNGTPQEQEAARNIDLYEWLLAWRAAGRPKLA